MNPDIFSQRHIGPNTIQVNEMLQAIGVQSVDELIDQSVPNNIRLPRPLKLEHPLSEHTILEHIHELRAHNKVFKSYIVMWYHHSNLPAVIQ